MDEAPIYQEQRNNIPHSNFDTMRAGTASLETVIGEKKDELVFKCQMGTLLASTLLQICLACDKLSVLPDVAMQLMQYLSVWNWSTTTQSEQEVTANLDRLSFQQVLLLSAKIERTLAKN